MAVPEPLLGLHGVSLSFGAVRALQDARLDLEAGEVHGLVGENGAGKSTLVKVAGGTLPTRARSLTGATSRSPGADARAAASR